MKDPVLILVYVDDFVIAARTRTILAQKTQGILKTIGNEGG
jgi:hypothetical protein